MTFSSGTERGAQVSLSKGPSLHLLLNLPLAASGMAHAPSDKTVPRSQSKLVLRIRCCWELFQGRCGDGLRGPVQTDKQGPRDQGRNDAEPSFPKSARRQPSRFWRPSQARGRVRGRRFPVAGTSHLALSLAGRQQEKRPPVVTQEPAAESRGASGAVLQG